MTTTTAAAFPLRIMRGTTGTVHAARVAVEADWESDYVKACGHDSNTMRQNRPARRTDDAAVVTCKKCLKATAPVGPVRLDPNAPAPADLFERLGV
jgi:hypothetical protein